ncbi:hypothetical protein NDU88_008051 [Pleurodeles waltl]|uniref:Reverse transcriptase zinc-binding domain-containing protein n=1 Tax=Pleurodeles waltl TaxID=8319 RepID=A0AAV7QTF6_PLEWA|nr:hypothetical protein NDU88_008051 [Pleurodeles waltl]
MEVGGRLSKFKYLQMNTWVGNVTEEVGSTNGFVDQMQLDTPMKKEVARWYWLMDIVDGEFNLPEEIWRECLAEPQLKDLWQVSTTLLYNIVKPAVLRRNHLFSIHRAFWTPKIFSRLRQDNVVRCKKCGSASADDLHMFIDCPLLRTFWQELGDAIEEILPTSPKALARTRCSETMGKRKADDVPAPPSGAQKHKKRAGRKIYVPPKPIRNQFQAIESLFEEVEAILRSPSITAPSIPGNSTIRKIPDLFIKKLRPPPLSVEADLHPPPRLEAVISSPSTRPTSNVDVAECNQLRDSLHLGSKSVVSSDILCSNRFQLLSTSSESPGSSPPLISVEPDTEELAWQAKCKMSLELEIVSQKLDNLKSLVTVILDKISGLSETNALCNCKLLSMNDHLPELIGEPNVLATLDTGDNLASHPKRPSQGVKSMSMAINKKGSCLSLSDGNPIVPSRMFIPAPTNNDLRPSCTNPLSMGVMVGKGARVFVPAATNDFIAAH